MEDGFLVVEEVVAVEGDYPSSQGDVVAVEEDCPSQGDVVAVEEDCPSSQDDVVAVEEDYLLTSLVVAKEEVGTVCTCTQVSTRFLLVCPVSSP